MSALSSLQQAIADKLASLFTATVGDGAAASFLLTHNFGTKFLYATAKAGATTLVLGTDYGIALTDDNHVTITSLAGVPGNHAWTVKLTLLRLDASPMGSSYVQGTLPIVFRRTKELGAEINAAAANHGLATFVMPPLPTRFEQGNPFVFFSGVEVRVRIVEKPPLNSTSADAYDLAEDVMNALHWQQFGGILAHPMQLAQRPCEMAEDAHTRILDVIFEAQYGQQPSTAGTV